MGQVVWWRNIPFFSPLARGQFSGLFHSLSSVPSGTEPVAHGGNLLSYTPKYINCTWILVSGSVLGETQTKMNFSLSSSTNSWLHSHSSLLHSKEAALCPRLRAIPILWDPNGNVPPPPLNLLMPLSVAPFPHQSLAPEIWLVPWGERCPEVWLGNVQFAYII